LHKVSVPKIAEAVIEQLHPAKTGFGAKETPAMSRNRPKTIAGGA
jgi:hypothetical protein